jgi:hypothetical protein
MKMKLYYISPKNRKAEGIRMNDDDEKIKSSWRMLFIL